MCNPFPYEERFVIRVDDPAAAALAAVPELRIISDPSEARALQRSLMPACADSGLAGLAGAAAGLVRAAADVLDTPQFRAHGEVLLQPGERVALPLVFLSMQVREEVSMGRIESTCLSF